MKPEKLGWYFVEIQNPDPNDDEVKRFNDWVEYTSQGWDLFGYEGFSVIKIIKSEA